MKKNREILFTCQKQEGFFVEFERKKEGEIRYLGLTWAAHRLVVGYTNVQKITKHNKNGIINKFNKINEICQTN